MTHRVVTQVVASIVVLVFAAGIWVTGDRVDLGWLRFYSAAVFVATLALNAWEGWVWRWSIAQRWASVSRDIRGTWKGTLQSLWVDLETNKNPEPESVYLVVRQTASTVSARLFTVELQSHSTLATVQTIDSQARLDYVYFGEPDARVEHRSRMHRGTTSLDITGRPASRLKGRYWTDRDSRGELDFEDRRPTLAENYEQAMGLFSSD